MEDRIELRGLAATGRHGWYEQEQALGQRFAVDLVLEVDLRPAGRSDDLADTVDYGALAQRVTAAVEGEPVRLLETLAGRLADLCLEDRRVSAAQVSVHKPEAPLGVPFDDVVVTIRRTRQ